MPLIRASCIHVFTVHELKNYDEVLVFTDLIGIYTVKKDSVSFVVASAIGLIKKLNRSYYFSV